MAASGSCQKAEAKDPETLSIKANVAIMAMGTIPSLLEVDVGTPPSLCDEV